VGVVGPTLTELEINETIHAEAERVGATLASICVERDPQRGLRALVKAAAVADRLKEALARYAFRSEVTAVRRSDALPTQNDGR